jgi:hypothetical protein
MESLAPLKCDLCDSEYFKTKKQAKTARKDRRLGRKRYCSLECRLKARNFSRPIKLQCKNCSKEILVRNSELKKSKSGNSFCSRSCAATHNSRNKTFGTRRSKLEKWLEEQLLIKFPNIEFLFNRKDAINSELDIYIPSLKLAFELNGIFHYEPIYGKEKLASIQNNDGRKFQACLEKGIELCIIDTSSFGYFKPEGAKKYFNIIQEIIFAKLAF